MENYNLSVGFTERMNKYINLINSELDKHKAFSVNCISGQKTVSDAIFYSLSAGGKRVRSIFVLEFCRVCGGNVEKALSSACALEMIHTFSLIHDDLPCMDDDDYRRGRLSCHKVYGEAVALLAGDELENMAYTVILKDDKITSDIKVRILSILSDAIGINGMIGGQAIDIEAEGKQLSQDILLKMYGMKTGALIKAACEIGCLIAGADISYTNAALAYAENLGLAFQIIDDILDINGTQETLGKPAASDSKSGKSTYALTNGVSKSIEYAEALTKKALEALEVFKDNDFLVELTNFLLNRNR